MDLATFCGILAGLGFVTGAWLSGLFPFSFFDLSSLALIVSGSLASLPICFPLTEIWQAFASATRSFFSKGPQSDEAVAAMVKIAEISRREGLASLEKLNVVNPLLVTAARLIAGGANEDAIIMAENNEIKDMCKRNFASAMLFERLGAVASALGIAGALTCLARVAFSYSGNPSVAGPAVVVAVLSAFYGALLARVLFLPAAVRIRRRGVKEEACLHIIFAGVRLILENNNPRLVSEKLSSLLPSKS